MLKKGLDIKHLIIKSVFLFLLVGLTACSSLEKTVEAKKPKVTIEKVIIENVTTKSLKEGELILSMKVRVDNPNSLALQVGEMHFDLMVNGQTLVTIKNPSTHFSVPAKSKKDIFLPVIINLANLTNTAGSLTKKKSIAYTIKGDVSFIVPVLGKITRSASYSGAFPLPKRPKLSLESVSLESLSLNEVALTLNVVVENPNVFDINIRSLQYEMGAEGRRLTQGKVENKRLAKETTERISIPLSINTREVGKSVYRLLAGTKSVSLDVKMKANITAPDLIGWNPDVLNLAVERKLTR